MSNKGNYKGSCSATPAPQMKTCDVSGREETYKPPAEQIHNQAALEAYDAHNKMLKEMQDVIEARKIRVITMRLREHEVEVDELLPIESRFKDMSVKTKQIKNGFQEMYFYKDMHLVIFDPVVVTNTYIDGEFKIEASQKYH